MNQNVQLSNLPDLLEIQRSSFCWFLEKGLAYELNQFSSLGDFNDKIEIKIYGQSYQLKKPAITVVKAKQRKISYALKLYVEMQLIFADEELLTLKGRKPAKRRVLIGALPLMTTKGSFIINGHERVVVNQIVRSPGVYYKKLPGIYNRKKKLRFPLFAATIITNRGSWVSFEFCDNVMWVKIDKQVQIPITTFLAALHLSNNEIYQSLKNSDLFMKCIVSTLEKIEEEEERIAEKEAKGEKPTPSKLLEYLDVERTRELINSRVFNPKNYDLGDVGRLKINKKLNLHLPLSTKMLTSYDILKIIDYLLEVRFSNAELDDIDSLANRRVRCVGELLQVQIRIGLNRIEKNIQTKVPTLIGVKIGDTDPDMLRLSVFFNRKPLDGAIKEFFGSSQLSQFMDETNPLAELTHKRRISALGPGGLNSDHVSFAARDIHPTQYGRLCPIETPEGKNAGLVASLASHAKVNTYGFIETPFFQVWKGKVLKEKAPIYLDASKEKLYKIASADIKLTSTNFIEKKLVPIRYNQEFTLAPFYEVNLVAISPIQIISTGASLIPFLEHDDANRALMGSNMQRQAVPLLYPQRPIVGTGLESQIASDACAGLVNTSDGMVTFVSATQIVVKSLSKRKTKVKATKTKATKMKTTQAKQKKEKKKPFYELKKYNLEKYRRSNQGTCVNQKPIVWPGQFVKKSQLLSDGPATSEGELALGQNLTVAYMPWEGYNYEDAILVSDRLASFDLFTSVHIEKYEIEVRETKNGPEKMTRQIPYGSDYDIRNLRKNGLIKKGALVEPGDILVGKITPKGEVDLLPEARLLQAIFGDKIPNVRDTSLRLPKGVYGHVLDVLVFSKEMNDRLPLGATHLVRVFVAEVRRMQIGDKVAGRHGNKGIVSKIMPFQDMPYLPDGSVVDLVFNPLGVPSRMNVGQLFESLLGLAGHELNQRFKILPFDEMHGLEASRILVNTKLEEAAKKTNKPWLFNPLCPGKVLLRDGRSGEHFDNPVLVGKSYILKLIHLVDDKIHARSTGPYSLVTQQPLGGKSQNGGQRFGEMEVWALEAFGAAYTLRELLTVKSDDMEGRYEALYAIVRGLPIPHPGIPESFKVLLRELQALGLDITTYKIKTSKTGKLEIPEVNLMTTNIPN